MKKRLVQIGLALAVVLGGAAFLSHTLLAQPLTRGIFSLATRPLSVGQNTLRVNTGATPQTTQIGVESFQEGGTTVNGLQFTGAATGGSPTIATISGPAGDTNIGLLILPQGSGTVQISAGTRISGPTLLGGTGTQFTAAKTGTCFVSPPTAITPFTTAIGQTPCTALGTISGDRVFVMAGSDLDNFVMLKSVTPGAGTLTLNFTCVSSSTCPALGTARTFNWWAITP